MNTELMFSSVSNEWETPIEFYNELNSEFNFTLDPCATDENHLCDKYYTIKTDGLSKDWKDETVFVNPPYGREIIKWLRKCYEESVKNNIVIVMLVPSRTDTQWFHKYVKNKAEVRFLEGRLKFKNKLLEEEYRLAQKKYKLTAAPFPSMVVVYNGKTITKL